MEGTHRGNPGPKRRMDSRIERSASLSELVVGDLQVPEHSAVETFRKAPQRDIPLGANRVHDRLHSRYECRQRLASLEETLAIVCGHIMLMDDAQGHGGPITFAGR
jgi:hypothetical protein